MWNSLSASLSGAPQLRRLDCSAIMQLRDEQQERALEAAADVDPRTGPSRGAAACTYWRWFRRSDMQAAGAAAAPEQPVLAARVS